VLPHSDGSWGNQVFAGCHRLDGNGEMTGLSWVVECGTLTSPVGLTNTHSVGVVRDALVELEVEQRDPADIYWSLRLVAKTWDGLLNDCNGFHVRPEHVHAAIADAGDGACTVGVLVQANHGIRRRFTLNGAPVGAWIDHARVPCPELPGLVPVAEGGGSVIVVVATDAPLLPHQCQRLAQRAGLGIARTGGAGEHGSGDLFIAFATANRVVASDYGSRPPPVQDVRMLSDSFIDSLFHATVEATEEAIVNAMVAAQTMTGRDDVTAHALPHDLLVKALDKHGLRSPVPDL